MNYQRSARRWTQSRQPRVNPSSVDLSQLDAQSVVAEADVRVGLGQREQGLRELGGTLEPELLIERGRAVSTLRRERIGSREVLKLDERRMIPWTS